MEICVITDNEFIFQNFLSIISKHNDIGNFTFYYSFSNRAFLEKYRNSHLISPIRLREMNTAFFDKYDVYFSLHCKQLFPDVLVKNYRCINVHPGYNPYNRGWYPQVFSIINKYPVGVTIHEMDEQLDHGPIIFQQKILINSYDTSIDVYKRVQMLEVAMLEQHLDDLVRGRYKCFIPVNEGNINLKNDLTKLCEIDIEKQSTYGDTIDLLRALTFGEYKNAYFIDKSGRKVYIRIELTPEEDINQKS